MLDMLKMIGFLQHDIGFGKPFFNVPFAVGAANLINAVGLAPFVENRGPLGQGLFGSKNSGKLFTVDFN